MEEIEGFFLEQTEAVQQIMWPLHRFLLHFPGLEPKLRYKIPFYYRKSWVCYLNPIKGSGVELAFTRANELSNAQGLLDFRGRTQVAGIVFSENSPIPFDSLFELVHEALLLDESTPYSLKRKP